MRPSSGGAECVEPVYKIPKVVVGHLHGERCFVKKIYKNARGEFIHVDRGFDPWSDFPGQLVHSPIHFLSMC